MRADLSPRRALVLGGTGAVGGAVLAELARRGVPAWFTYRRGGARAAELAATLGADGLRHTAVEVDLTDAAATAAMLAALPAELDVAIHCACASPAGGLAEAGPAAWQEAMAVQAQAGYLLCRWAGARGRPADVVLVNALDRAQSLPLPPAFAAAQGAVSALAMAAAHELGPRGVRVNVVALGPLTAGISAGLAARRRRDFEVFSALRRPGTPDEAARVIGWLALENTFIQGKVISANGGI